MVHILVWIVTVQITSYFTGAAVQLLQLRESHADFDLLSLNSFKLHLRLNLHFLSRSPTAPTSVSDITQSQNWSASPVTKSDDEMPPLLVRITRPRHRTGVLTDLSGSTSALPVRCGFHPSHGLPSQAFKRSWAILPRQHRSLVVLDTSTLGSPAVSCPLAYQS